MQLLNPTWLGDPYSSGFKKKLKRRRKKYKELPIRREHIVPCQWPSLGCCPHQTRTQWQKDARPHPDTSRTLWSSVTHLSQGLPGCDTGDGRQVQNISSMKCRHIMLTCTSVHTYTHSLSLTHKHTTHSLTHTRTTQTLTHTHTHTLLPFFLPLLAHAETNSPSSHHQGKRQWETNQQLTSTALDRAT